MRGLEAYLGVALFRRTSRGLVLTGDASAVLPDVRDAFDRLAAATQRLRVGASRGLLTVAVSPSFGAKWLMPRLDRFDPSTGPVSSRPPNCT